MYVSDVFREGTTYLSTTPTVVRTTEIKSTSLGPILAVHTAHGLGVAVGKAGNGGVA